MYEPLEKTPEKKSQGAANAVPKMQNNHAPTYRFVDKRPEAIQMRRLRDLAKNSPQNAKLRELHNLAAAHSVTQKKSNGKQGFGFVDNRPEAIAQRKLKELLNTSNKVKPRFKPDASPVQMVTALSFGTTAAIPTGDNVTNATHARVKHSHAQANQSAIDSGYANYASAPGECNHYVPYANIKNTVTANLLGSANVGAAVGYLNNAIGVLPGGGVTAIPVGPNYNGDLLNTRTDEIIAAAANHRDNLYMWPDSYGDGGGTVIDIPKGNGKNPPGLPGLKGRLDTYHNGYLKPFGLTTL